MSPENDTSPESIEFIKKLELLKAIFIDGEREIKPTKEVAEEGEETATIEIDIQNLYSGEYFPELDDLLFKYLGVSLESQPYFSLVGDGVFYDVFLVPSAQTHSYVLVSYPEEGILVGFYEETLLEIFMETEGLLKIEDL